MKEMEGQAIFMPHPMYAAIQLEGCKFGICQHM